MTLTDCNQNSFSLPILASFAIKLVVLMDRSAVSMASSFEADENIHDLVGEGEKQNKIKRTTTICFVAPY